MTINYRYPNCQVRVSIHTPTQGVTISFDGYLLNRQFQSTHPRRVWLRIAYEKVGIINVSIHTPTQGVTLDIHLSYTEIVVSIHTPTQGVTVPGFLRLSLYRCFNPHTHAGCDYTFREGYLIGFSFNPHTHAGCDLYEPVSLPKSIVSIHTPTQGVTLYLITYYKSANLIHCYANHHYYSTS